MPSSNHLTAEPTASATKRIKSQDLFLKMNEVEIDYEGRIYRLRLTQLNKLILTAWIHWFHSLFDTFIDNSLSKPGRDGRRAVSRLGQNRFFSAIAATPGGQSFAHRRRLPVRINGIERDLRQAIRLMADHRFAIKG